MARLIVDRRGHAHAGWNVVAIEEDSRLGLLEQVIPECCRDRLSATNVPGSGVKGDPSLGVADEY
jgi:hypothetical protein